MYSGNTADGDGLPNVVESFFGRTQNKMPEYTEPKEKMYTKTSLVKSK